MASFSKSYFLGNIGKDPEIKMTTNGKQVANFSLAVTEKYNGNEKTEWINLVAWNKTAEIVERYVIKGMSLFVECKHQSRTWDKPDGSKGYAVDYVVLSMQMLGGKSQGGNQRYEAGPQEEPFSPSMSQSLNNVPPALDDDLPF